MHTIPNSLTCQYLMYIYAYVEIVMYVAATYLQNRLMKRYEHTVDMAGKVRIN